MAWCPFAQVRPASNHSGAMYQNLGLVLHVQQGNNDLGGEFNDASAQASSNFWVAKDGTLVQYVDSATVAWAQAAGNGSYCSVETQGFTTEPLTDAAMTTLARLYQWGHQVHGWPFILAEVPGQVGFGWHGMGGGAWGGHTGCPGDLRKAQRPEILRRASGASPPPEDDLTPDQANQLAAVAAAIPDIVNRLSRLEDQGTPGMVNAVANAYLGRDMDPTGMDFYWTDYRKNTSSQRVHDVVTQSPEGKAYAAAKRVAKVAVAKRARAAKKA